MDFKLWLNENEHQDEQFESLIAETVYKLIDNAVRIFFQKQKQTRLSQIIKDISKGQANDDNGRLEITIPNKIKGTQLPDHFFQHGPLKVIIEPIKNSQQVGASYGYGHLSIKIDTPTLAQANDYKDENVQKMMIKLQYQLHHETTHISSAQVAQNAKSPHNSYVAKNHPQGSPEYNQGKADYYTDPGELRAHAKQYAILYKRYYPNQPFDVSKMLAIPVEGGKIKRFFQGLNDPDQKTWGMDTAPYQQQMTQAGSQFMQLVNYFMQ